MVNTERYQQLTNFNWRIDLLEKSQKFYPVQLAYSQDLSPSGDHSFAWMDHTIAAQRFGSYEDVKKWLDKWFAVRRKKFSIVVFTNYPKDRKNV